MAILGFVYVVAAVLFLFGAAIFVHEYGHYWMARQRGLKIEEFAIGFGPKMFAWTNKDGVVWSVRWFPAGGFVKLPQMITSEALEGAQTGEPLPPASPWSKILVAFAGPFMNVVFGFVLATIIYFVGLPVPVNPAIVGFVDPKSAEWEQGIREGDRIVAIGDKPVASWQDITFEVATASGKVLPVTIERAGERKTYQLATKPGEMGLKWLNLSSKDQPVITEVRPGTPAEAAGFKVDDRILAFGGLPVGGQRHLIKLINDRPNQATEALVKRGDQELRLVVTPKLDEIEKVGRIGVTMTDAGEVTYELQKPGPLPWANVTDVTVKTYRTISALINSKRTGVKASDLSGPVGIFAILGLQVQENWRLALNFMVLLNINLAVLNLLPIPVLDGGHIVMALIERVRRKPVSVKIVEWTTTAFAVLLISFMLYVTFHDVNRFSRLFKRGKAEPAEKAKAPAPEPAPVPAK